MMFFRKDFSEQVELFKYNKLALKKSLTDTVNKSKEYIENQESFKIKKDFYQKNPIIKGMEDSLNSKWENYQKSYIKGVVSEEKLQSRLIKSLCKLTENDPSLFILREFDIIIPEDKFKELTVNLVKAYKSGIINSEKVLDLKNYKRINLEKGSVFIKDNRTHYADCIILNEFNEVLLLKRNNLDDFEPAKYCLPGGHVERDEDSEHAAIRELVEETGIVVTETIPSGHYVDNKIVIHYYTAKVKKDDCQIFLDEREHQQYEWVNIFKLEDYSLIKNLKDNFREVISIPVSVINPLIHQSIFPFYQNGNLIKSKEVVEDLFNKEKLIKSSIDNKNLFLQCFQNKFDIETFSIYKSTPSPMICVRDSNNIEKAIGHKYYKREGTPGNYKYYYTKEEYEKAKGKKLDTPKSQKQEKVEVNTNDPYTYKDTNVLVNKFGIRELNELVKKERDITGEKLNKISKMDFSANGFKKLHNELFGSIYEWAGKTRTVNLSSGNVAFAPMRFLEDGLNAEFQKIQFNLKNKDNFSDEQWVEKAGDHFGEVLFIHPFREGNGRSTRKFIDLFLEEKGLSLNWEDVDIKEYYSASEEAINKANNTPLKTLFKKHISK